VTGTRLDGYVDDERERITGALFEWLAIPSISAHADRSDAVRRSAEWLVAAVRAAGADEVEVLETDGHPAVFAEWSGAGPDAPTVLVYGHHDVQPVDPEHEWRHPPFEPVIVDGECLARGAIDDKGQVLYQVEAIRGLIALEGRLPVNVKLLVEGEEEIGSPHFEALLRGHAARLAADVIVVSDTGMLAEDVPSTDVSMRGLVAFTVTLTTSTTDLHSGIFGGAVPNPLHHLTRLLAALHDEDGRVAIPGFADDVAELSQAEAASLRTQPFDEDAFRRLAGVPFLEGEPGRSTLERVGSRPTAEVVGISGGYAGDGIKTIVPASASAKVTFRLVPDQDPERVMDLVEAWIRGQVADGIAVELTRHGGVAPARTPTDHWAFSALCASIERVWGAAPLLTRVGGSGPEETLGRVLGAPVLFLGVGLPGDRIHAPNERMVMAQFWRGLLAAGELLHDLAAAAPTPAQPHT
jgi:acetylornithine deacetylase/succinyl-diaminopimelate desuccinylase-like protein